MRTFFPEQSYRTPKTGKREISAKVFIELSKISAGAKVSWFKFLSNRSLKEWC
jgi:hypothetical protein